TLPSLVPGVGGSVNLEWRRPGLIFEIEVDPAGRLEAYIFDDAKHEEWEGQYAEIEWRVGEVISRFSDPA
ncbi:MAG TPA: hypothetical protein VKA30_08295, partial [Actinomycetota bacterium]|nr:hypothetical protein [Actinomycetota bacterium]